MPVQASSSSLLIRYAERPEARLRVLCFPHAGGGASTFASLNRALPSDVEVCALQLPGRGTRRQEPPIVEMAELMEALGGELGAHEDRRLVLFGYSLGALIAFEYARALRTQGARPPVRLLVSAARAPHRRIVGRTKLGQLPSGEFVREMRRRYDGIPEAILKAPSALEYFLPVLRADVQLVESYRYAPEAPLECPIFAFGGDTDPRVPPGELEHWSVHTRSAFESQVFSGGHFFIQSDRRTYLAAVHDAIAGIVA
ncbi:MAG: alpha/beta fold hydrolase [Myxococcales bacterium]|nr:alpha/beta fold hydrolase [Myxococcales bacterium]